MSAYTACDGLQIPVVAVRSLKRSTSQFVLKTWVMQRNCLRCIVSISLSWAFATQNWFTHSVCSQWRDSSIEPGARRNRRGRCESTNWMCCNDDGGVCVVVICVPCRPVEGAGSATAATNARLSTLELCISGSKMFSLTFHRNPFNLACDSFGHLATVTWLGCYLVSCRPTPTHSLQHVCVQMWGCALFVVVSGPHHATDYLFFSCCDYNLQYVADFFSLKLHLFITK